MQTTEYQWKTSDKNIYGKIILPDTKPEKVIIFIHGIGEHIGRYDKWFKLLTKNGFAIVTADHIGHGHSEGKRGHFKNYSEPMEFAQMLLDKAEKELPKLPKFIYGHSMGGNVALNFVLRKKPQIAGAIISSPWVNLKNEPSTLVYYLAKIFRPICPTLTFKTGIRRSQLTSDNEELDNYKHDNLIHNRVTVTTFLKFMSAIKYIKAHSKNLHIPTLLMCGTADPIINHKEMHTLKQECPKYITLKLFDGFLHEIHKETKKHLVLDAINEFTTKNV